MTVMQQTFPLTTDTAIPAVGTGTYPISSDDGDSVLWTATLIS